MVSRQTCEVRRRLPHEVHFSTPKRNCYSSIMEARGVTNACGHQEAPTAEVGAFARRHGSTDAWAATGLGLRIRPLDCRKSFSKYFCRWALYGPVAGAARCNPCR